MRIVTAYWCDERKILVYEGIKKIAEANDKRIRNRHLNYLRILK